MPLANFIVKTPTLTRLSAAGSASVPSPWRFAALLCALVAGVFAAPGGARAHSAQASLIPAFDSCSPESDNHDVLTDGQGRPIEGGPMLSGDFCAEWNPEFSYNGFRCCSKVMRASVRRRRRAPKTCSSKHFKPGFCGEVTEAQREYIADVSSGKIKDPLQKITEEIGRKGQAYCTVNNGFLAWGRPIVPTASNRVMLNSTDRCTQFGTDGMIGLLEWLGQGVAREYVDPKYSQVKLVVGDIAAPRGGCLSGRNGPRGHASHTNGQDADIGFLTPLAGRESPRLFHTTFDAKANWWLIKQILNNPFACVKVIFLDQKLKNKLHKVARGDPDWTKLSRFVKHIKYHRNHLHVRIGDGPGQPGCSQTTGPEDEEEESEGIAEAVDLDEMDLELTGPKPASATSSQR